MRGLAIDPVGDGIGPLSCNLPVPVCKMVTKKKSEPLTHEEDPILSCSEVGRAIGKHRTTIWRWCKDGLIKAHRMPSNHIGVRKSEVNKILAASALTTQVK